ncbi:MAG: DUF5666 domain-containing protein [Candidatus Sulfotelmatobacter sp.]
MSTLAPVPRFKPVSGMRFFLSVLVALAFVSFTTGCGSGSMSGPSSPALSGNTAVTVVLSSTANDHLSEFGLVFQNIALTSQSGKTVTLFTGTQGAEFMDVNGGANPFVNMSIPQDIYTAATVTLGSAEFTCITIEPAGSDDPGGLLTSTFAYGQTPTANVSVNLPAPITITGNSMGLALDLLVSQSATFPGCYFAGPGIEPYSITPTFTLTPINFVSQPTNPANGKVNSIDGEVTAVASTGNTFTLTRPLLSLTCPCPSLYTLPITANSATTYQGIGGFSALAVGMLIDMDGAIQSDGSLLATRIAAYDPTALNVMTGPLLFVDSAEPDFYSLGREEQGQDYSVQGQSLGVYSFSDSTVFQTSGQFNNLATLPFTASFDGSTMVAGQNVSIYSQALNDFYGGQYTASTTITLMPQTIDGTVADSSQSGNFSVYTVSLAPYDLFPTLATQPGQVSPLTNPSQVEVYVDSSTQMLNTQALAAGSTLRFGGLVFNDNGTLRMDCAQVNNGVPFTPSSNANALPEVGQAQTTRRAGPGGTQIISAATRSH